MTLGEKIRAGRLEAGLTQEQLALKLSVTRQAVTKWEADKGIPDIENLKALSDIFNISLDHLLGKEAQISVVREAIDLNNYSYKRRFRGRWVKSSGKKDIIVREKYPDAEIHCLMGRQISTGAEKAVGFAIFLAGGPFGSHNILNGVKNIHKEFYLVNDREKQYLVTVTDKYIESIRLSENIHSKSFEMEGFSFTDCGLIPE